MTALPRTVRWTFGTATLLALTAAGAPPSLWSQNRPEVLPPAIRACVAEADAGLRVDCFDWEVARLIMPPDRSSTGQAAVPLPGVFRACVADADANRRRDCYDREVARLIMPPERTATAAAAAPPIAQAAPNPAPAAPPAPPAVASHISAQVTAVGVGPDRIVVHLDNGQAWEQAVAGNTDLSLHNGDTVRIDRQLGAWWLTNRYGDSLKVQLVR